jgi:Ran GTPase-activating protein (RanGAP) involved in mRNA processing and transport
VSKETVRLDLSGNKFGPDSSEALAKRVAQCSQLETLLLNDSYFKVEALFDPKNATLNTLSNLIRLDLGGNSMKQFGGPFALQMVSLIAMLTRLEYFGMRDTQADPVHVVAAILSLMLTNNNISCAVDVSGCSFTEPGAPVALQKGLQTAVSHSLRVLDLSRIMVPAPALNGILLSLIPSESLDTLIINRPLSSSASTKEGKMLAKTLATLSAQKPLLKSLKCAGIGENVCLPLLEALCSNTSLLELDISENLLRDVGATVFSLFLRINTTLEALEIDGNEVTLPGFLALRSALVAVKRTSALKYMKFPWGDYDRIQPLSNKHAARAVLLEVQV